MTERSQPAAAAATATVVGGGPAGLMAAEVLAEAGFAVRVYEHKPSVGRKFLLAGRGGLNITHSEPFDAVLSRYGPRATMLRPALEAFGPADLRAWCAGLGEPTFVGSSGRVFPQSFRATPLLRAWLARLAALGVDFRLRHRWVGFDDEGAAEFTDADGNAHSVHADVTVLALGGASWPRVGSDGEWAELLRPAGVEVEPLQAANCGVQIEWSSTFAERFGGVPLKNIAVSVPLRDESDNGGVVRGDCVVTARGLEGGPIYAHSAAIRAQLNIDEADGGAAAIVNLDLKPDLSVAQLAERLAKRRRKESTSTWLRKAGFDVQSVGLLREATKNRLPAEASDMAVLVKAVPIVVAAMMPVDRAISSAGGVSFDAVDECYMLRSLPGVYAVGEMLDWEAPTGGYLLQACFSTAVAAATCAVRRYASA